MSIRMTYYLDVTSSWCYWAEPAWSDLKRRYSKSPVEFDWKIALLDSSSMSKSREQLEWFYRRSGTIVSSPFMLNSAWLDPIMPEFLAPNCVAEAAKEFGVKDDSVRLALMVAAIRQGKKVADWKICGEIAAKASSLNAKKLLVRRNQRKLKTVCVIRPQRFTPCKSPKDQRLSWKAISGTVLCSQVSGGWHRWWLQLIPCWRMPQHTNPIRRILEIHRQRNPG